jgi:hypothetical protein
MPGRPGKPRARQFPARRGHLAQLADRPGAGALPPDLADKAQPGQPTQGPVDLRPGYIPDSTERGPAAELKGDRKAMRGLLTSECPSRGACSPVLDSNYVFDLGGAKRARTADLLHAMKPRHFR